MNLPAVAALLAITFAPLAASADEVEAQVPGRFARFARQIWNDRTPPQRTAVIASPDGRKAILIGAPRKAGGEARHDVRVRVGQAEHPTEIGSWADAEAAWAPDSKAFFVTYSDAGDDGTFHVVVVQVGAGGLRVTEPVPDGRALFRPACAQPELLNVAAVGWPGRDASRLVVAVIVPPGSTCAGQRTFRAFELRQPGARVMARTDQLQAKREYGVLMGSELLQAPDACVTNPSTCPAAKR
jgi:hypothetical protein